MIAIEKFFVRITWSLIYVALSAIALGCGGASGQAKPQKASEARHEAAESEIAIPDNPHLLLPASCFGAISINLDALRPSAIFKSYIEEVSADRSDADKRVANYIIEQAHTLVIGLVQRPKNPNAKPLSVLIGRGDFDVPRLLNLLNDLSAENKTHGMRSVKEPHPRDGKFPIFFDDGKTQGLILDSKTVLVADIEMIPEVLDLLTDRDVPRFINSDLYKRMSPHIALGRSGLTVVSSLPTPIKNKIVRGKKAFSFFTKYEQAFRSIKSTGMRLSVTDGVEMELIAETTSRDSPQIIVDTINGLVLIGRIAINDPTLRALADQFSTRIDGLFLRLNVHATEQQVAKIIEFSKQRSEE
jgi:hypothetical protein